MEYTQNNKNNIKDFFIAYEKATNAFDLNAFSSLYADTFMFGSLTGVISVKKDDFLKMLPKRRDFFATTGLKKTTLVSFEEVRLDDEYNMVKVTWTMHYEKDASKFIDNESSATYILFSQNNQLQIVMQIDHQDLMQRVKELGLT